MPVKRFNNKAIKDNDLQRTKSITEINGVSSFTANSFTTFVLCIIKSISEDFPSETATLIRKPNKLTYFCFKVFQFDGAVRFFCFRAETTLLIESKLIKKIKIVCLR